MPMQIIEHSYNFCMKKYHKNTERKFSYYIHPVTEMNLLHGEDVIFRTNGMIKESCIWNHGKKDGVNVLNYEHKGDFDKKYLLRTFTNNEQNGVEVFFHKH